MDRNLPCEPAQCRKNLEHPCCKAGSILPVPTSHDASFGIRPIGGPSSRALILGVEGRSEKGASRFVSHCGCPGMRSNILAGKWAQNLVRVLQPR